MLVCHIIYKHTDVYVLKLIIEVTFGLGCTKSESTFTHYLYPLRLNKEDITNFKTTSRKKLQELLSHKSVSLTFEALVPDLSSQLTIDGKLFLRDSFF